MFEGESLTYGELDARANRLAHRLRAEGVGPGALVGLCLERSPEMVVAALAALKAGAAYVPLDTGYPWERLALMLADSGVPVVITQRHVLANLPSTTAAAVCLDDPELQAHLTTLPAAAPGAGGVLLSSATWSASAARPRRWQSNA